MKRFMLILEHTYLCLVKYSNKPTVIHLVSSRHIVSACRKIHNDIDVLIDTNPVLCASNIHTKLKTLFDQEVYKYETFSQESMRMDRQTLFDELQEPEAQQEALALLMFEFDNRESQYAEGEIKLIHRIFLYVSSFSKLGISDVPKWFVPPQDVDIEKEIARGSFGSVHHGRWNGAKVVVKSAFRVDPLSRKMFLQEANIWHKLQHSYIVRLYGACHAGNPFFVCEFAANGTLSEYLD